MNTAEQLTSEFQEVPLSLIKTNPNNARNFDNMSQERLRSFDELVQSVQQQGVIQAITLRPDQEEGFYQIVAGERRFRATTKVAEIDAIPLTVATIPAIIRDYNDKQTLEVMATENLIRDDFSPREESTFFAQRIEDMQNAPDSYKILSKTYGLEESAIRLRVALLQLPETILNAFDVGTITIGHAELFCKISDETFQTSCFNSCVANRWTIRELNTAIKTANPQMKWAKFSTEACASCLSNSATQRQLFETPEESVCLKPSCFRAKQFAFFEENWIGSKGQELFKTNRYHFHDDLDPTATFPIVVDTINSRCGSCPEFVTAGSLAGGRVSGKEKVCIGDKKCFDECYAVAVEKSPKPATKEAGTQSVSDNKTESEKKAKEKTVVSKAQQEKKSKERAKQRGIDQREALYKEKMTEHVGKHESTSPTAIRISLTALLLSSSSARKAVVEAPELQLENQEKLSSSYHENVSNFVLGIAKEKLLPTMLIASTGTIMNASQSNPAVRVEISSLVGIEIAEHWTLNLDYLKSNTKDEIVKMGEEPQMALWADEKIKAYKELKFGKKGWMSLAKKDLIACVLESGADLQGKIPQEIALK